MAQTVEELPLSRGSEVLGAVTEILPTPALRRDRNLHEQIERANDSVDSNLKEGFEAADRTLAFANFVFTAKGSTAEVIARMRRGAPARTRITDEQLARVVRARANRWER